MKAFECTKPGGDGCDGQHMTEPKKTDEQLAREYADGVAMPILRSMLSMSRGQMAEYLANAFISGLRMGRERGLEEAAEAADAEYQNSPNDSWDSACTSICDRIRALKEKP